MDEVQKIQKRLDEALEENKRLREKNASLKKNLEAFQKYTSKPDTSLLPAAKNTQSLSRVTNDSPSKAKIALFRSLFRGRVDVFPIRWESKKGLSGYSPSCRHEWDRSFCDKPRVKCRQCDNREFLPVTDDEIYKHLTGKQTMGVYPLLHDDTCYFLAADFDKSTWREDAAAYMETCRNINVSAAMERSRSGNGCHVWILFTEPVAASLARKLGCTILTMTMEKRHQIGLDSYDRFFPNQDTLPKGGFGNLIALPLQKKPRDAGNTVFLDEKLTPYPDQWAFLAELKKVGPKLVEKIVYEAMQKGEVVGIRKSQTSDEAEEDPWTLPPSGNKVEKNIKEPLPEMVKAVNADLLYIEKEGLPPALQNQLIRVAAFQNSEFYKAQAMRLPTYDKPRIIACAEDFPKYIGLPRGCRREVENIFKNLKVKITIQDERTTGRPLKVSFKGKLRTPQQKAVKELRQHDIGILSAATAFGKTVIAAKLIAVRKRNTLILVHRRQLLDQWRERLAAFLGIPVSEIGQIGGGRKKASGKLDVAILQSLHRKGEVDDVVADYGHVIVDECHHISAFSFEQVMKKVKAKYVLGLTATPVRKDGHHPIVIMQCGPIRYRVHAKNAAEARPFNHFMIPRVTQTRIPPDSDQLSIQEIYRLLVLDKDRNRQIVEDIIRAVNEGRSPLILTERTDHLQHIASLLDGNVKHVVTLKGGMGKKQRAKVAKELENIGAEEERVLVATGRYIGEGFDDPRLDTLFLVLPISWRGTIQQYAGRLHRIYDGKKEVRIYDYLDSQIPMLVRMYEKRLKGYKNIGYSVVNETGPVDYLFEFGNKNS